MDEVLMVVFAPFTGNYNVYYKSGEFKRYTAENLPEPVRAFMDSANRREETLLTFYKNN